MMLGIRSALHMLCMYSTRELYLQPPLYLCVCVCVCVCGIGDGTQGHSTSKLHPQPYLIFILKQGLARLLRVLLHC